MTKPETSAPETIDAQSRASTRRAVVVGLIIVAVMLTAILGALLVTGQPTPPELIGAYTGVVGYLAGALSK